jgi:hypothetical protein
MLRYACGYAFANKGHDTRVLQAYLGKKNILTHVHSGHSHRRWHLRPLIDYLVD